MCCARNYDAGASRFLRSLTIVGVVDEEIERLIAHDSVHQRDEVAPERLADLAHRLSIMSS